MWLALVRGEMSTVEAADRAGVDRSTIVKLRQVGTQGALDAFAASPRVRQDGPDPELAAAQAEIARLSEALTEMGRPPDARGRKRALGRSRVPRRVDAATKHKRLDLIDNAVLDGWLGPAMTRPRSPRPPIRNNPTSPIRGGAG